MANSCTAVTFLGSGVIPVLAATKPRYSTWCLMRQHFFGFKRSPAARRLVRTCQRFWRCPSKFFPITRMSSRYTMHELLASPTKTVSMRRWNVEGALHSPNGMIRNWSQFDDTSFNLVMSHSVHSGCLLL